MVAPGLAIATGAGLLAQARRVASADLPHLEDCDPSGHYGDPAAPTVHIDVLGDSSVTAPGLVHGSRSWIAQLVDRLPWDVRLCSHARGGSRVRDVLHDQVPAAISDAPDLFVVAVGANDAFHATPRRQFCRDLGSVFDELAAKAPVVTLGIGDLSVIPRLPWTLRPIAACRSATVDRLHRRVSAGRERVTCVPVPELSNPHFRGAGRDWFVEDLFHPGDIAHSLWARLFEPYVRSQLDMLPSGIEPGRAVRSDRPSATATPTSTSAEPLMETLSEAIARLRAAGYRADFSSTAGGMLRCGSCGSTTDAATANIDEIVRFEGTSDPGDEAILVALRCTCGEAGLFSAAYGLSVSAEDADVLRRLPAS